MKALILLIIFSLSTFFSGNSLSQNISAYEREKRKYVSRIYQVTEGAIAQCPNKETNNLKNIVAKFNKTYPSLNRLIKNSIYYQRAVNSYSDDIERSKNKKEETLLAECKFIQNMLLSMIETEEGRESTNNIIAVLSGKPLTSDCGVNPN